MILYIYCDGDGNTLATSKMLCAWIGLVDQTSQWQDKLKFLLTALKIYYVLDPNLEPSDDATEKDTEEIRTERKKRQDDELICCGHNINALSDQLYDLYTNTTSAKKIWDALEHKYKAEESKKFLISKYFDFKKLR